MNRLIYFFFGFVLVCVLVALLWAAKTHEEAIQSLPEIVARDFTPLLQGETVADINTGLIEKRVENLKERYPYIEKILIRKMLPDGSEATVYPWYYDVEHPDTLFIDEVNYITKSIVDEENDEVLGMLHLRISARRSQLFKLAIGGSMIALVLVIGLGLYTIRSKEEVVWKTTTLLEEKQRELIHLERLALVGQVTANLLHDLKKPVLNIRAELEQLPDSEAKQNIVEESDLFLNMLRELHLEGFLRQDVEKAEFLDVAEILDRSLRLVKYARENVEVVVDLPEDFPFLFGQRHKLIQVFSNILLNAYQALEGEGKIHISGDHIIEDEEEWVMIAMTDNGPGMPYEVLSHIFDPFYSTRKENESTGLGLYITKTIVESMGGNIYAKSIPKHGTTFTLYFPLSQEERE